MFVGLKPYTAMKHSGVPWLGSVPEHWIILPNRAIFAEVLERDHPAADMLSVTIANGVVRQRQLLEGGSKKDASNLDRSAYKLVRPGDIAYNKMRAWQGAIGVSPYQGIVSPAYVVQRPRGEAVPRYLHYLLRTPAFAKEAERWSYGITSDMWSLRPEHFRLIPSCLPPVDEQAGIVRFLDHADRRIRRYIRAKQKLIHLLEEQKQAIIHRAVTRGLDPGCSLKPSGVEWLGEVPAHWVRFAIRQLAARGRSTFVNGPFGSDLLTTELRSAGVPVIYIRDISRGMYLRVSKAHVTAEKARQLQFCSVIAGDILVAKVGDPPGTAAAYPLGEPDGIVTQDVVRIRPNTSRVIPEYLVTYLNSRAGRIAVGPIAVESTRGRVSLPDFKAIPIVLPPLSEQQAILGEIKSVTAGIRLAVHRAERELDLLREFHTRLISDIVTGKLDVREAAALLPNESASPEPIEESDTSAEEDCELTSDPEGASEDAGA